VRHRLIHGVVLLVCLVASGPLSRAQTSQPGAVNDKFLKYVTDDRGGATLQASIVTYRNGAGQLVDLVAAVHVADASFYRSLNERFKSYDSLLYELIKPKDMDISELHDPNRPASWISMVQMFLKNTLKLQFQLDAINYDAPNFVHADLDVESFERMQAERGESITGLMVKSMLKEMMDPDSPENQDPTGGLGPLLLALSNPDKARGLKMMLGSQFGQMDQMLSDMEGPDGSVLLGERNKACMSVLRQRLAMGEKKIGIFYGAGHLRGMEKILTGELGFVQVGEPKWQIAWDMTAPPTTQAAALPATMPGQ
jgi:hypothetical protein